MFDCPAANHTSPNKTSFMFLIFFPLVIVKECGPGLLLVGIRNIQSPLLSDWIESILPHEELSVTN